MAYLIIISERPVSAQAEQDWSTQDELDFVDAVNQAVDRDELTQEEAVEMIARQYELMQ